MPFRAAVMKIALHRFVNLLSGSKRQTGEVFLYMAEAFLLLRLVWGGCRSAEGRGAAFFEKVGTCFLLSGGKIFRWRSFWFPTGTTGFGASPAGGILLRGACKNRPTCSSRNAGCCFHDVENQMFLGVGLQHYCKPALPETGCRRT